VFAMCAYTCVVPDVNGVFVCMCVFVFAMCAYTRVLPDVNGVSVRACVCTCTWHVPLLLVVVCSSICRNP
jgi:hypothetical protein